MIMGMTLSPLRKPDRNSSLVSLIFRDILIHLLCLCCLLFQNGKNIFSGDIIDFLHLHDNSLIRCAVKS